MPSRGRLSAELGFFDGAWKVGRPKPVTFSVHAVLPGGKQLLYQQTLDPVENAADRGPQSFSIDLNPVGPPDEPVELLFEAGPDTPWGWVYWAGLDISP